MSDLVIRWFTMVSGCTDSVGGWCEEYNKLANDTLEICKSEKTHSTKVSLVNIIRVLRIESKQKSVSCHLTEKYSR
jgi:hypothetical protein